MKFTPDFVTLWSIKAISPSDLGWIKDGLVWLDKYGEERRFPRGAPELIYVSAPTREALASIVAALKDGKLR